MALNSQKTIVVTGANRGLGLETVRQLSARGCRVILTCRDPKSGEKAIAHLGNTKTHVEHFSLDVSDRLSISRFASTIKENNIVIDYLINNAAIALDGFNAQVAAQTIAVNFFGAMNVTDALIGSLRDGGGVVMVSSGLGSLSCVSKSLRNQFLSADLSRETLIALMESFVDSVRNSTHTKAGWPSSAYSVSKVGLNALVRILSKELQGRSIQVNAVCPGWVRTDMGGAHAPRSVEEGAASILAALPPQNVATGLFLRDGQSVDW